MSAILCAPIALMSEAPTTEIGDAILDWSGRRMNEPVTTTFSSVRESSAASGTVSASWARAGAAKARLAAAHDAANRDLNLNVIGRSSNFLLCWKSGVSAVESLTPNQAFR